MNRLTERPGRLGLEGAATGRVRSRLGPLSPRQVYTRGGLDARDRQVLLDILRASDGRIAGFLVRTKTGIALRRVVDVDRHLLRLPEESWCFDFAAVGEAEAAGAVRAEVHDPKTGACWWVPLGHLLRVGERIGFGPHGVQLRLPLRECSYLPGGKGPGR